VFILTHHAREPVTKVGGTTFTFVTGGIESALEQARAAAGEKEVAVGGGANVAQQYLRAGWWTGFSSTSWPCSSVTACGCSRTTSPRQSYSTHPDGRVPNRRRPRQVPRDELL
jgi:hypothetical protein